MKSTDGLMRFGDFTLDPANRRLFRANEPVELGGRYFDALVLLASAPGELVSKDRLHDEVWRGVPVTDEALSQAIKTLRRTLGDDAAKPRYIETVPRHGYRFIATPRAPATATNEAVTPALMSKAQGESGSAVVMGAMAGSALAGLAVGLAYSGLSSAKGTSGVFSLTVVLVVVSILSALVSGAGIAAGIGLASRGSAGSAWRLIAGGAAGGWLVGGLARLIGIDALRLLTGSAPDRIAGALEGLAAGAVAGFGYWVVKRGPFDRMLALTAFAGGLMGAATVALGGTLLAGSLASLVERYPDAGLTLAWATSGWPVIASGAMEGAVFIACLVGGMVIAVRRAGP